MATRSRGLFRRQRHGEGHFGSGAVEQESDLGRDGWLEWYCICLGDLVSLSAPPRTSLNINFISRSTHSGFKSKTYVVRTYLPQANSFTNDVPIAVALKALGDQSDKEILLLCAQNTESYQGAFSPNLEKAAKLGIFHNSASRRIERVLFRRWLVRADQLGRRA